MTAPEVTAESLFEDIRKLSPPDQLRLAAELLEKQRPRLALAVAAKVVGDLNILHLRGVL